MNIDWNDLIRTTILPSTRDLGDGFQVKRVLPAREQMMVGPFIFFDEMGPTHFKSGQGLDVRPHPHIGLATVTYLFEGEILHRDSVGSVQTIRPGEVNWMTAGRGIVHSERTGPVVRAVGGPLSGIQLWLALPKRDEEAAPTFTHFDATQLPRFDDSGARITLIAGEWSSLRSPVKVFSPLFYADAVLNAGARLTLPSLYEQRAVYVTHGSLELRGQRIEAGQMLILQADREVTFTSADGARAMLLGGEPLDGARHIWWNFVSSSEERIRQAQEDWRAQRFAGVPDEDEFIPSPDIGTARPRSSGE
jgi:redox-sensitive bicupin YhaK (pirin superfamily)